MLENKTAIVTGASSGIGAALAVLLAKEAVAVVLAARRADRLDYAAGRIRALGGTCLVVPCDVSKRSEAEDLIRRAAGEFGRIDILVNNAGRGHFASVEDTTDEIVHSMFAVNVFSLWYTTRPALAFMKRQGNGHIINVASMAGKLGYPYNSAYVAAKHACVGFTYALRQELAETNIQATVVCPAGVTTEWANMTEGGPMREFFSQSRDRIKCIAEERGIALPSIEGVKSAEDVASSILECIYHPVPEVYTHRGSREFVMLAMQDRERAEQQMLPVVLGEREVYEQLVRMRRQESV